MLITGFSLGAKADMAKHGAKAMGGKIPLVPIDWVIGVLLLYLGVGAKP